MRKLADIFSTLVIFLSIAILVAWFWVDQEREIFGRAIVLDGDTVMISNEKIRLEGIDAPEHEQKCTRQQAVYNCGDASRNFLKELIGGETVHCDVWGRDKFDRFLGKCSVGERELNQEMVRNGWAVSFGAYEDEEAQAHRRRIGLWKGDFERPVDWRASQKAL